MIPRQQRVAEKLEQLNDKIEKLTFFMRILFQIELVAFDSSKN